MDVVFSAGHSPVNIDPLGLELRTPKQMIDSLELLFHESLHIVINFVLAETARLQLFEFVFGRYEDDVADAHVLHRRFKILDMEFVASSRSHILD